jgi:hypothetical protein
MFPLMLIATLGSHQAAALDLVPGSNIDFVYIVTFAHADVGFNAPPSEMSQNNHDRTVIALDLAEANPTFKWTVETTGQLEDFLERASASDLARFEVALGAGQLGVGAGYLNLHTGLCGEEELNRLPYAAADLVERYGYQPRVALLNDVPGRSWAIPRVFASAGVPYAIMAPNNFLGGKPDIPLADRPFWWESKDGSRLLSWITYDDVAYMEGWYVWGLGSVSGAESNMPAIIRDWETNGYPFNALLVDYASDDNDPFSGLHKVVDDWNAKYDQPTLILSQPEDFFDYLLAQYGDVFPVYSGDAAGFWEDVSAVSPVSTKAVRGARARLPLLQALWAELAVEGRATYPYDEIGLAWQNALLIDEHSGAGVGWPGLLTEAEVNAANAEFLAFATACETATETLQANVLDHLAPDLVPTGQQALVLFNPLAEAYDGVIDVTVGQPWADDLRLVDAETGTDLVFRWNDETRLELSMRVTIPAFGWKRVDVGSKGAASALPVWSVGSEVTSGDHRLVVNADGSIGSLTNVSSGIEWIAPGDAHDFAGIEMAEHLEEFYGLYEKVPAADRTVYVEEDGPLFRRIRVEDASGQLVLEYRLYADERRLDVSLWLDRGGLEEVPYALHSMHYGTAFPANLSLPTTLWVDGPDGWFRPGVESLPGTALHHFGISTGARLEGADGRWLSVTSLDTPMLNLGEMNGSAGSDVETDENALNFKLIRDHSYGLTSDQGEVLIDVEPGSADPIEYRFVVRLGDNTDDTPSRGTLAQDMVPPLVQWVESGTGIDPAGKGAYVEVEGAGELVAMKMGRLDDGTLVLRIRADEAGGIAVVRHPHQPQTAWLADLVERPVTELTVTEAGIEVPLVPSGVVTVLLADFEGPEPEDTGDPRTDDSGDPASDDTAGSEDTGGPESLDSGGPARGDTGTDAGREGCGCAVGVVPGGGPVWLCLWLGSVRRRQTVADP